MPCGLNIVFVKGRPPIVSRKTHVALKSLHAVVVVWVDMLV